MWRLGQWLTIVATTELLYRLAADGHVEPPEQICTIRREIHSEPLGVVPLAAWGAGTASG